MGKVLLCIGVECEKEDGFDKVINVDSIFNIDVLAASKKDLLALAGSLLNLKKKLENGEDVSDELMKMDIIPKELKELIEEADKIDEIHIRTSNSMRSFTKSILGSILKEKNVVFEED